MSNESLNLTVDITLSSPIIAEGGVKTDKITMRRPKVKDRLLISRTMPGKSPEEQELVFIANLCGTSPDEIEGLFFHDYEKLQEALMGFRNSAA